jgi:sulfatase-like protein
MRPTRASSSPLPIVAGVALAAKLATIGLRLADGGGRELASPWAPLVLFADDAWLVLAFACAEALAHGAARVHGSGGRLGRTVARGAHGAVTILFGVIVAWMALNIPIARVFSTPATFSMLNASGGALADSVAVYLTVANVGIPLALGALATAMWRLITKRGARRLETVPGLLPSRARAGTVLVVAGTCALVVIGVTGRRLQAHVPTLGLHRNAVVTLAATTIAHLRALAGSSSSPGSPSGAGSAGAHPSACHAEDGRAVDLRDLRGAAAGRNVIWIILESTAARFLTPYGASREVTPNLAALARDALVFDDAYAAYPESIKGLFSMLCARPPLAGREAAQHAQGRTPCTPLPAMLRAAGYRTGLFHSGRFVYLGMREVVANRGFDALEDGASIGGTFRSSFGVDEASTVRKLLAFVDGLPAGAPFFAVYSPIAGHHPYHAPGDGPRPFPEHTPTDAYANDLFAGDAAFGLLRGGMARRGLDDRTLYVVVGDHGEAFFEHEGNFAHTLFLYEENVRVPFIVAAPGAWRGVRRAPQLASLIDVAPTLLDLLGLRDRPISPSPGGRGDDGRSDVDGGRSLLDPRPRLVRFFTDQGLTQSALRDGRWKLIAEQASGRTRLYDLARDPGERHDVADAEPGRTARYSACLAAGGG